MTHADIKFVFCEGMQSICDFVRHNFPEEQEILQSIEDLTVATLTDIVPIVFHNDPVNK